MCNEKIVEKTELTDDEIVDIWLQTSLEEADYNWSKKVLVAMRKIIAEDRKLRQNS